MSENLIAKSSIEINAPVAKVWDALTNPELIKQYLFGSEVVTDWQEGSPVIYKGNYQGKSFEDKGTIVKNEPKKLLVMTHWSPLSGTADTPENYHTVTYKVTVQGEATHVSISQDKNSSEDERKQSEEFWTTVLQSIKKMLEN